MHVIKHMDRKYFNTKESKAVKAKQTPTMNIKPEGETPVTFLNIASDEFKFIVG